MDTMTWLNDVYGTVYNQVKYSKKGSKVCFDDYCWTTKDIKTFFEDLRYGDVDTYNKCITMYPHRKQKCMTGIQNAINRYDNWYLSKVIDSLKR